jgi:hypothetical protein
VHLPLASYFGPARLPPPARPTQRRRRPHRPRLEPRHVRALHLGLAACSASADFGARQQPAPRRRHRGREPRDRLGDHGRSPTTPAALRAARAAQRARSATRCPREPQRPSGARAQPRLGSGCSAAGRPGVDVSHRPRRSRRRTGPRTVVEAGPGRRADAESPLPRPLRRGAPGRGVGPAGAGTEWVGSGIRGAAASRRPAPPPPGRRPGRRGRESTLSPDRSLPTTVRIARRAPDAPAPSPGIREVSVFVLRLLRQARRRPRARDARRARPRARCRAGRPAASDCGLARPAGTAPPTPRCSGPACRSSSGAQVSAAPVRCTPGLVFARGGHDRRRRAPSG